MIPGDTIYSSCVDLEPDLLLEINSHATSSLILGKHYFSLYQLSSITSAFAFCPLKFSLFTICPSILFTPSSFVPPPFVRQRLPLHHLFLHHLLLLRRLCLYHLFFHDIPLQFVPLSFVHPPITSLH